MTERAAPAGRGAAPRRVGDSAPVAGPSEAWLERATEIARTSLVAAPPSDVETFVVRLRRWWNDLWEGLVDPYGGDPRFDSNLEALVATLADR